ncbi:hypothetical protein PR003_g27589 [Phytophthora rubi]|uniref:RxLR effector protein n=1 Tax=Phytophthora rubi TaxID=129364 RepID=A0A6A4BZ64_9STRA|nr:hypothetical protein PR002_g26849 [Phytophthora rubi]KAE8972210.1 hypothetical protein PR001_g26674 [Phytophthora rubi]KAE9281739.1 hypothetical protein PR003_g27589 [Phytophthora rubi]
MIRKRVALVILAAIAATSNTQAIDWTFWNDDDDSTASPGSSTVSETLSPEALKSMMGSDYMDAVRSLISSGSGSDSLDEAGTPSRTTTSPPSSSDSSHASASSSSAKAPSTSALSLSGSSSLATEIPPLSAMAKPSTAVSTVTSNYRNWVGPWSQSADSACYREAHIMDTCPSNYDRNELTHTC